jgi:ATP-dependent DNA ligase
MHFPFQPMPLSRRPRPFNHPEWLFELKYDGFRALARIEPGKAQLISRNGHPFASFLDLAELRQLCRSSQQSEQIAAPQSAHSVTTRLRTESRGSTV